MPYAPHMRVVFGGNTNTLGTLGVDIWQNTVNCFPLASTDAFCDAYLAAIQAPLKTWFTTAANGLSNTADLRFVKANLIGEDGKYVNATVTHRFDYTSIGVGGAATGVPGFCSLAWSWTTPRMRGPGSHGRIYPPNAVSTAGTGFSTAAPSSIAVGIVGAKALLTVLSSSGTTAAVPSIASGVDASLIQITGVKIGNLIDVQRRRRNAISETYSAASFP